MFRVFIVGDATEKAKKLVSDLVGVGLTCSIISSENNIDKQIVEHNPDLILLAAEQLSDVQALSDLANAIKRKKTIVVIALLSRETLDSLDPAVNVDDFVLEPWAADEVVTRSKRVLRQASLIDDNELIRCGDLIIDKATCEVSISGKLIELTFKEYELLIFLASNRGRVFSREVLLDRVWGYDYFGGDRTVDVHIRRLRSKIEDANHTFVETVRNIGYRFKKED